MNDDTLESLQDRKKRLRDQAHANRNAQTEKDELSREICAKFVALPAYVRARTVMYYIDVRSEVRTRQALPEALSQGKKIVVPWCNERGELELFHLENMEELAVGMYKILEPRQELRGIEAKRLQPADLDLIMVPGVAFDRTGARMGHGKGYYDKLLQHARADAPLVALAFECQLFPEIPTAPHDIFMDLIITEKALYDGKGRHAAC
jgi:5-formyltetrahydrofolate cyclo-ligase